MHKYFTSSCSITLLTCLLSFSVHADKLDDFKNAVGKSGCESIPYSDLSSNCSSQGKDMHPWCDGKQGPVACDRGVSYKLKQDLETERRKYDDLRRKKSDLESAISRAAANPEKEKLKKELEPTEKALSESERASGEIKDSLKKRAELFEKTISTI